MRRIPISKSTAASLAGLLTGVRHQSNANNGDSGTLTSEGNTSAGPSPPTGGAGMAFASSSKISSGSLASPLTGRGGAPSLRVQLKRPSATATSSMSPSAAKAGGSATFSASAVTEGSEAAKAQSAAAAETEAMPNIKKGFFSSTSDATKISGMSRAEDQPDDVRDLTAPGIPETATGYSRAVAASGERVVPSKGEDGDGENDGTAGEIVSQKSDALGKRGTRMEEDARIEALGSPLYGTLQDGTKMDPGPLRPTGMWNVSEVVDEQQKTVDFRRIDDVESEIMETLEDRDSALVLVDDEEKWKHKLMFTHKFKKTPKHLTWKEMGQEIECLDCIIDLDPHRPEERFNIKFQFVDKRRGARDIVWEANNDVSYSEGFTDLMAAIGSCLGRADVFRTIRFDDGKGTTREITVRKKSRFTSDIQLSFRPVVTYNLYERKEGQDNWEKEVAAEGLSPWGFHPQLMDPEYRDVEDPEGTYTISLSAHAFSFIMLRCIDRLITRPMKDFYRPSQVAKRAKAQSAEEIGLSHAMKGWLGLDEQIYPHYTPIEALQEHWLGPDAPFTFVAIVNKLREMTYLKKKNPEFTSWLAVRQHDTAFAIRNISVKMLGAGASTLFVPRTHNSTANFLLPKSERRRLESRFSINAALGMPDETKNIAEFKKLTGNHKIEDGKKDDTEKK